MHFLNKPIKDLIMKNMIMTLLLLNILFAQTSIYTIQYTEDAGSGSDCYPSSYSGQTVTTNGTVTGIRSSGFYMQSGSGAWNGIYVYDSSVNPSIGDELDITAEVAEYYGLTELTNVTDFTVTSTNNSIDFTDVTTGELANGCSNSGEAMEGALVRLSNVTVTALPNNYGEWYVDDGSGPCQIDDGMFTFTPVEGQTFDYIIGNVDFSYSEYGVHPRSATDVVVDASGASIGTPTISPETPTDLDEVTVQVVVTHESGITNVTLSYTVSDGGSGNLSMAGAGETYFAIIPPQAGWTTVSYTITATAGNGSEVTSQEYSYSVIGSDLPAIFFSEWAEGSSNNKYLEIFNGTESSIDLSLYSISSCSNGCDTEGEFDYPDNVTFPAGSVIASGEVFVVCHPSADPAILEYGDQTFTYLSNGDDIMALTLVGATESEYVIVDIIGEMGADPGNGWDVAGITNGTQNHTIVRKSNVTGGNNGNWAASAGTNESDSEWIVFPQNTWDNLGIHSQNINAPSIAVTVVNPSWITDASEIEITAELIPVSGSIAYANILYGTDGSLLNEAEMWQETDNLWMGIIPAQTGNSLLEFKISAMDDTGNSGESVVNARLIASSTLTDIETIHNSISGLEGEIVTINGVVTIGSGLLSTSWTSAYIQDNSGRGLNLYSPTMIDDILRGNELTIVGYVEQYNSTVELVDFIYNTISTGNPIPEATNVTTSAANSSDWEGTLVSFSGTVTAIDSISDDGAKLSVDDGSGSTLVLIWNSTGLNGFDYSIGSDFSFTGVGNYQSYYQEYQTLVAYADDIVSLGIDDKLPIADQFVLLQNYPNPFNPITTISYHIPIEGHVTLTIYDLLGNEIKQLVSEHKTIGMHHSVWKGTDVFGKSVASGMYFYRLSADQTVKTNKLLLLK